jgi:hypothetical protein
MSSVTEAITSTLGKQREMLFRARLDDVGKPFF